MASLIRRARRSNEDANKVLPKDRAAHDWYRFVLSFPPHLVRDYLAKFGVTAKQRVLDPFCGTGTTLVECQKLDVPSVGVEANPMAYFATKVKVDWHPDPGGLKDHAHRNRRSDGLDRPSQMRPYCPRGWRLSVP